MKYLYDKEISYLNLDKNILNKLDSSIKVIKDLCSCNRKKLKTMGLNQSEINMVIIILQLNGLDLSKK